MAVHLDFAPDFATGDGNDRESRRAVMDGRSIFAFTDERTGRHKKNGPEG